MMDFCRQPLELDAGDCPLGCRVLEVWLQSRASDAAGDGGVVDIAAEDYDDDDYDGDNNDDYDDNTDDDNDNDDGRR